MRADHDSIDVNLTAQLFVHGVERVAADQAVADIGLVGHNDHDKPCGLQVGYGACNTGQKAKLGLAPRRIRFAISDFGAIEHAVAIEKNSAPIRPF